MVSMKIISRKSLVLLIVLLSCHFSFGQLSGARGGVHTRYGLGTPQTNQTNSGLDIDQAQGFITVEGSAEMRIDATRIRIVLAVTSEEETSVACSEKIKAIIESLRNDWSALGIESNDIDEDFISILPVYKWKVEGKVATEYKTGHRMQTNLHIAVANEAKALEVLNAAYQNGITDIIGFDYWSEEIEVMKAKSLAKAISNARTKAHVLLSIFDEKPKVINITEDTKTIYPSNLYESFQNTYNSSANRPSWRDVTFIHAFRPKNTYYKGFQADVDTSQNQLAMSRQISIVSTVQVYYQSPAAELIKSKQKEQNVN